jgi:hypothetical protein
LSEHLANGCRLSRFDQLVQTQRAFLKRWITGVLQKFPIGLDHLKILVKQEKKFTESGQDPFGKDTGGLHLLVFFQDTNNQILPLLFKYLDGPLHGPLPFVTCYAQTLPETVLLVTLFTHF